MRDQIGRRRTTEGQRHWISPVRQKMMINRNMLKHGIAAIELGMVLVLQETKQAVIIQHWEGDGLTVKY